MKKSLLTILVLSVVTFVLKSCKKDEEQKTSTTDATVKEKGNWEVNGMQYTVKAVKLKFFTGYISGMDTTWYLDAESDSRNGVDSLGIRNASFAILFPHKPIANVEYELGGYRDEDVVNGYVALEGAGGELQGFFRTYKRQGVKINVKIIAGKLDVTIPEFEVADLDGNKANFKGHIIQD